MHDVSEKDCTAPSCTRPISLAGSPIRPICSCNLLWLCWLLRPVLLRPGILPRQGNHGKTLVVLPVTHPQCRGFLRPHSMPIFLMVVSARYKPLTNTFTIASKHCRRLHRPFRYTDTVRCLRGNSRLTMDPPPNHTQRHCLLRPLRLVLQSSSLPCSKHNRKIVSRP